MHALPSRAGTAAALVILLGGLATAQDTVYLSETPPITGTLQPAEGDALRRLVGSGGKESSDHRLVWVDIR